jgi:hypothetical protein
MRRRPSAGRSRRDRRAPRRAGDRPSAGRSAARLLRAGSDLGDHAFVADGYRSSRAHPVAGPARRRPSVEQGGSGAAVRSAGARALQDALRSLDRVDGVVRLDVFVVSAPGFTDQPKVSGASDLLVEVFGEDRAPSPGRRGRARSAPRSGAMIIGSAVLDQRFPGFPARTEVSIRREAGRSRCSEAEPRSATCRAAAGSLICPRGAGLANDIDGSGYEPRYYQVGRDRTEREALAASSRPVGVISAARR